MAFRPSASPPAVHHENISSLFVLAAGAHAAIRSTPMDKRLTKVSQRVLRDMV
jgi:hypothetical protein